MALHTDLDAFLADGVGAFMWVADQHGRVLWLLVPWQYSDKVRPFQKIRLYMRRDEKDWAVPGEVNGWDGNIEFPTLDPSIQAQRRVGGVPVAGWHGHLKNGVLEESE